MGGTRTQADRETVGGILQGAEWQPLTPGFDPASQFTTASFTEASLELEIEAVHRCASARGLGGFSQMDAKKCEMTCSCRKERRTMNIMVFCMSSLTRSFLI